MDIYDETAVRALRATAFRGGDWLFYRYWPQDTENLVLMVNANDVFYWATSDCVEITPENIELFESTVEEVQALATNSKHDFDDYDVLLFAARARGMRPQGAYYEYLPRELWELFDAAGPERSVDVAAFGNPQSKPDLTASEEREARSAKLKEEAAKRSEETQEL